MLILWHNLKSEETCKNNVLKGHTNWKYGTDVTSGCAGAIEKLEVATAGNTDAPQARDARSNGKMESTHGCPVLSQPRHTQGHGLFIHVALVM